MMINSILFNTLSYQKTHINLMLLIKVYKSSSDMAKVQINSEKITPLGGTFSIMELFDALLSKVIDATLEKRC